MLANDKDNEGNLLTAILVNGPEHGTLTLNANGSFDYQPSPNFFGTDSFVYKANDGLLDSNTATVIIRINSVNDAPQADAGEDQVIECRGHSGTIVVLDGSASADIEGDTLTYTWTGPFPEGNGTVTGVNPAVTLPLGTHTLVLTVNDGNGGTDTDEILITIEDTLPPVITAQWVPLEDKKEEFRVEFNAVDICAPNPQVIGVIETPSLDGLEFELKQDDAIKIKFDLKKQKVEIQGPDPNALLNQLRTYGGIVIQNGQQVEVDIKDEDKKQKYELEKDGWLKIKAATAILKVMAEDASGNKAEVRISPDIRDDRDYEHGEGDRHEGSY